MSTIKKIINNTQTNEMYEWKEVCKAKLLFSNFSIALHLFIWLHMSCCCYHTLMHNNRVPLFTIFVSERDPYMRNTIVIDMRKKKRRGKSLQFFPSQREFSSLTWNRLLRGIETYPQQYTLLNFFMNIFQI